MTGYAIICRLSCYAFGLTEFQLNSWSLKHWGSYPQPFVPDITRHFSAQKIPSLHLCKVLLYPTSLFAVSTIIFLFVNDWPSVSPIRTRHRAVRRRPSGIHSLGSLPSCFIWWFGLRFTRCCYSSTSCCWSSESVGGKWTWARDDTGRRRLDFAGLGRV